jgi:hypothetical protein
MWRHLQRPLGSGERLQPPPEPSQVHLANSGPDTASINNPPVRILACQEQRTEPRTRTLGIGTSRAGKFLLRSPMRTGMAPATRPDARSPRFRRSPFARDAVFDPGAATASRMATPHMLPSLHPTSSARAVFPISRRNVAPHTIAVYASPAASSPPTQHSLPSGRYPLPGPDFHRLDTASFPGALDARLKAGHERLAA